MFFQIDPVNILGDMKTVALIVAGGRGLRLGGAVPKQFRNIYDRPLLTWTISQFEKAAKIDDIMLVIPEEFLLYTNEKVVEPYHFSKLSKMIVGGKTRQESVMLGLRGLPISTSFLLGYHPPQPSSDGIWLRWMVRMHVHSRD